MLMAEKSRGLPLPHLREWRVKKLIGQSELADLAKIARATVTRAERGDEVVSFANIRKLAQVLGISPDDLLRKPPVDD
jgi:transcriptional regulator with XRE-family HTH domain